MRRRKTKKKGLPSTPEQLRILKQKGIQPGNAKTKWTIYRLYNFYITKKQPKSTPRAYAYATQKQLFDRIQKTKNPDKLMLETGSGRKIKIKTHIRKLEQENRKKVDKILPREVNLEYAKTYRTVDKIRDHLTYHIRPSLHVHTSEIEQKRNDIRRIADNLIDIIQKVFRSRQFFYQNYMIGGKIVAEGKNFLINNEYEDVPLIVSMPWTRAKYVFDDEMMRRMIIDQGFDDILKALYALSASDKSEIIFYRVEIKFSTDMRPSNLDRLRT